MMQKIRKILQKNFDYHLEDYALFEVSRGNNKVLPFTGGLFIISTVLLILEITDVYANFMNAPILIFLMIVLVFVPIAFKKDSKYEAIIVTPKYLIQRIERTEYVVVEFDKITEFEIVKKGIVIKENRNTIILGVDLFKEEIEPIVEILEAKGKTFDPEKEFMIRPINIVIENNIVTIEDDEYESSTEKLYKKYHEVYPMLTPGFADEIIFRNSSIEDLKIDSGSLVLFLDRFLVKGGHPENTTFENLSAIECVLIFESIIFEEAVLEDLHKVKPNEKLKLELEEIVKYLNKSVISEWELNGKRIEMIFATGVQQLRTTFKFHEVIIGWKKVK